MERTIIPNLRKVGSEFLSIPIEKTPSDDAILKETLIAESIRLALIKNNVVKSDEWGQVHILSLRNWVIKKLRGLIPEIQSTEDNAFLAVLREGPGPNLEFLGDIIRLSGGYYIPAPSRVIQIKNENWLLISGYPTQTFTEMGLDIEVEGVCRRINNLSKEKIREIGLSIQPLGSYIENQELMESPKSILDFILEREPRFEWMPEKGWEAYCGLPSSRCYGFDYWGLEPLEVEHHYGMISIWRAKREWDQFEYWLRVKQKRKQPKERFVKEFGRTIRVIETHSYEGIRIPKRYYKYICIAIEMTSGRPREVRFKSLGEEVRMGLNFIPPASVWRWLHGIGAKRTGYSGSNMWLTISKALIPRTIDILKNLEVKIVWE